MIGRRQSPCIHWYQPEGGKRRFASPEQMAQLFTGITSILQQIHVVPAFRSLDFFTEFLH